MAVLTWKHGMTRNEVRKLIQERIEAAGVSEKVKWNANTFTASVAWGAVLNLVGEINEDTIVLQKSSGAIGSVVLAKSREAFEKLFPDGEEVIATSASNTARQNSAV